MINRDVKNKAAGSIQCGIYKPMWHLQTLLSDPTRSGKDVSCVMPTRITYPGSVIVLDFKGESFNYTICHK